MKVEYTIFIAELETIIKNHLASVLGPDVKIDGVSFKVQPGDERIGGSHWVSSAVVSTSQEMKSL